MVKFLLVLYFSPNELENSVTNEDFDAIGDNYIEKMVEMPVTPRVGEFIEMGNILKVVNVKHVITERKIEVECNVALFDGVAACTVDSEGWNLDNLGPSGKELFLRRLEQFKAARFEDRSPK